MNILCWEQEAVTVLDTFAGSECIADDGSQEQFWDSEQTEKLPSPNEFDDALAPSLTQIAKQSWELQTQAAARCINDETW